VNVASLESNSRAVPACSEESSSRPFYTPLVGRVVLLGLFILQVIGLTVRFDVATMTPERTWGYQALSNVHYLGSIGTAALACLLIGMAARREGLVLNPGERFSPSLWLFLIVNLAGYCFFWALSAIVFETNTRELAVPALACAIWCACGFCWVAGAVVAVSPPILGRWAIRALPRFLPIGIAVAVAMVAAGEALARLWDSSGGLTFWTAYGLLRLIEPQTICEPAQHLLGTPRFGVIIDKACSGYQGIGLVLTLLGFYLWCFRRTLILKRAIALLPIGVVAIWAANVFRIAALVLIGDHISPEVAVGGFHSQAGSIMFNLVGLGLIALSLQVPWFRSGVTTTATRDTPDPTVVYLAPQVALIATMMLTAAMTAGFDWAYPLRVMAVLLVLAAFRRSYTEELLWTWSWLAVANGVAVFAVWMALEALIPSKQGGLIAPSPLVGMPTGLALVWLVARVLGSVLTVPVAEELAFRGYLTRRMISNDFTTVAPGQFSWPSFVGSSVLFGLMHGRWLAGTLAGMSYALAFYRRGQLADAIVAHAVTNALIAATVLLTGAWGLWS
jgi:exosortase E/protease (VPEID-CTERM system)